MGKSGYTIICATAGVALSECVQSIVDDARDELGDSPFSLSHQDVAAAAGLPVREMVERPRLEAVREWNRGLDNALANLDQGAAMRIVSCHLTLFSPKTRVFFAPAIVESFCAHGQVPQRIILLIDDIFDMFQRLDGDKDIFNRQLRTAELESQVDSYLNARRERFVDDNPSDDHLERFDELNARSLEFYHVAADVIPRIEILQTLLSWRRSEMVTAENLASQLKVPLTLMGVKHPRMCSRLLVRSPEVGLPVTYISHPITRHRVERQTSKDWNVEVVKLNQLPEKLAARRVVGIMPTAIDELRFASSDTEDAPFIRTTSLTPRWPLMPTVSGLIGDFTNHRDDSLGDIDRVLSGSAELWENDHERIRGILSGSMRALNNAVESEVPFRDYYIVGNCPHLFVFQPRERGNEFSNGVHREIKYFEKIVSGDSRMAIVHSVDDVKRILSAPRQTREAGFNDAWRDAKVNFRNFLGRTSDQLSGDDLESLLDGRGEHRSLLAQASLSPRDVDRQRFRAILLLSYQMLTKKLSALERPREWCRIFVRDLSNDNYLNDSCAWIREAVSPMFLDEVAPAFGLESSSSNISVAKSMVEWICVFAEIDRVCVDDDDISDMIGDLAALM